MEWLKKIKVADKLKFFIGMNIVFLIIVGAVGIKGVFTLGTEVTGMSLKFSFPISNLGV